MQKWHPGVGMPTGPSCRPPDKVVSCVVALQAKAHAVLDYSGPWCCHDVKEGLPAQVHPACARLVIGVVVRAFPCLLIPAER